MNPISAPKVSTNVNGGVPLHFFDTGLEEWSEHDEEIQEDFFSTVADALLP
ncbi:MAG: hypothetical protein GY822_21010 [Deltaproteobacteria bacterium]|nr:hypothetical protein [Deltaproteobacteria bacterium]